MSTSEDSNAKVTKNSIAIMLAQGLGIISGFGFDVVTAATFGLGLQMDAFFVALVLPQVIVSVLASNGMRALSPLLVEAHHEGGDGRLQRMFSSISNLGTMIMLVLAFCGIAGAPILGRILAPGLPPEGMDIVLAAIRVLFISMLPVAMIEALKAVHIFHRRFFLATSVNFFRYSAALIVLVLLKAQLGIMALAWAYVAGSVSQLLILGIAFFMFGGRYSFTWGRDLGAGELLLKRIGPPILGDLVGQSGVIVERFLASFLPPGVTSALGYGRRILVMFNGLFVDSVSIAILPRLSQAAIIQDTAKLRQTVVFGETLVTLLTGLVAIFLMGLSKPFITLFLQRGSFDAEATNLTALILSFLAPSILFIGLAQPLTTVYFALGETQIAMYTRVLGFVINVILDLLLFSVAAGLGLALAYTLSRLAILVLLIILLSRKLDGFGQSIYLHWSKLLILLVVTGSAVYLAGSFVSVSAGFLATILEVGAVMIFGVVAFGLLGLSLKVVELRHLTALLPASMKRPSE